MKSTESKFVDFVNTTGSNIGEIQNTKLANFVNVSEGAIRLLRKNNTQKLNCLYLGALCSANDISKDDLITIYKNRIQQSEEDNL